MADPYNDLLLSSISITEIAVKTAIGKLETTSDTIAQIVHDLQLIEIAYEPRHANKLFGLPLHHHDPFDRMLIATALLERCPILSSDIGFKKYKGLQVIW